jgi:hypothetical protein
MSVWANTESPSLLFYRLMKTKIAPCSGCPWFCVSKHLSGGSVPVCRPESMSHQEAVRMLPEFSRFVRNKTGKIKFTQP